MVSTTAAAAEWIAVVGVRILEAKIGERLADELGPEVDLAEFVVVGRELGQHCLLLVLKCIGLHC